MGDTGSLLLGFLLAALVLKLRFPVGRVQTLAVIALMAAVALFDTSLVVVARLLSGRRIYVGGRDHTSHRLVRVGFGVRTVSLLLGAVTAICTTLAVVAGRGIIPVDIVAGALAGTGVVALMFLLRVPVYDEPEIAETSSAYSSEASSLSNSADPRPQDLEWR
jgi:UDP-GlcNAc:undecaprenyl-phosphate GlcNAc-1-phosphate transferase